MTLEAFNPTDTTAIDEPLTREEYLISRRISLHRRLGTLSIELNEISRAYNTCIADLIHCNQELRDAGFSPDTLLRELETTRGLANPAE